MSLRSMLLRRIGRLVCHVTVRHGPRLVVISLAVIRLEVMRHVTTPHIPVRHGAMLMMTHVSAMITMAHESVTLMMA